MKTLFDGKYKYKGLGFDFDIEKESLEWIINYLCCRIRAMDSGYCECIHRYNRMRERTQMVMAKWSNKSFEEVQTEINTEVKLKKLKKIILSEDEKQKPCQNYNCPEHDPDGDELNCMSDYYNINDCPAYKKYIRTDKVDKLEKELEKQKRMWGMLKDYIIENTLKNIFKPANQITIKAKIYLKIKDKIDEIQKELEG